MIHIFKVTVEYRLSAHPEDGRFEYDKPACEQYVFSKLTEEHIVGVPERDVRSAATCVELSLRKEYPLVEPFKTDADAWDMRRIDGETRMREFRTTNVEYITSTTLPSAWPLS